MPDPGCWAIPRVLLVRVQVPLQPITAGNKPGISSDKNQLNQDVQRIQQSHLSLPPHAIQGYPACKKMHLRKTLLMPKDSAI